MEIEESGSSIPVWEDECSTDDPSAEKYKDLIVRIRVTNLLFSQMCSMPIGELTMLLSISSMSEETGAARVSSLHNALKSSKPAVSRMIHILKKKGYVEMKNSEEDQRYVFVRVTDAGKTALKKELSNGFFLMEKVRERMGRESMDEYLAGADRFYKILAEEILDLHHGQEGGREQQRSIE